MEIEFLLQLQILSGHSSYSQAAGFESYSNWEADGFHIDHGAGMKGLGVG